MERTVSDKLRRALNTAGSWFLLTQIELILDWTGENGLLVETLYQKGFDREINGTRIRVSAIRGLIQDGLLCAAIQHIRDSKSVNRQHPEAYQLAQDVLVRRFGLKENL